MFWEQGSVDVIMDHKRGQAGVTMFVKLLEQDEFQIMGFMIL